MRTHQGRSRTFPFRTRFTNSFRGPVAYFDEGAGDAVVFVHGLVGDFTHFEHVAPAFRHTHRVVGLDLPGCGLSCKPTKPVGLRYYAREVLALLKRLGIGRATLVGHSAGGQVVAEIARVAPEKVDRLVLINGSGLRDYPRIVRLGARALMQPRLLAFLLQHGATWILDHVFHQQNPYTEKFIADSLDRPVQPTMTEMCKVFGDLADDLLTPTVRDSAHRLTMPTLVVWGDRDRLVPVETVRAVASSLPAGRFEVLADCGHLPMIEHPHAVIQLLQGFLAREALQRAA